MKLKIVERHTSSSEALRAYVVEKTEGLERYFDGMISVDVVLSVEKERQIADFHAHLTNRKVVASHEVSTDMYVSIDGAIDKLRRQLVKYKDHLQERRDRNQDLGKMPPPEDASDVDQQRSIIRTDTYFRKPILPEEAALQLDAIEKGFLVFFNAESDQVNVIYHRRDGNYGLIEPRL